jgi:hypothetical protein
MTLHIFMIHFKVCDDDFAYFDVCDDDFAHFYRFDIPDEDLTAGIGRGQGEPVGDVLEGRGSVPPDLQHRRPVLI